MVEKHEQEQQPPRSRAEIVERLRGLSRQHDEEDIEYWQRATDEMRGRALYSLLKMVDAIGNYPQKQERFPGFPKQTEEQQHE